MPFLITLVLALITHLLLGWGWTVLAACVGGYLAHRRGWLVGTGGLVVSWGLLTAYAFIVAPGPVQTMTGVMASLLGNMPGAAIVGLTLLIAALIGALGGAVGQLARALLRPEATRAAA